MNPGSSQKFAKEVIEKLSRFFSIERARELWDSIDHAGTLEEVVSRAIDKAYADNANDVHRETTDTAKGSTSASSRNSEREQAKQQARTQYAEAQSADTQAGNGSKGQNPEFSYTPS